MASFATDFCFNDYSQFYLAYLLYGIEKADTRDFNKKYHDNFSGFLLKSRIYLRDIFV